jgi:hypothetical protein
MQDVEPGFVRKGGGFCHKELLAERIT